MTASALPARPEVWLAIADDDMAATKELLRRVAGGQSPPVLRLYQPRPTVAFSRRETHHAGFGDAWRAAQRHGFLPVVRNAGGRAVAYGPGSLVVEVLSAHARAAAGVAQRFDEFAGALARALGSLGVAASVGQLNGEYCPGSHSIIVNNRYKVAGTAQRVVAGGWLCAASIVVSGAPRLREVLTEVYRHLQFPWCPETLGAVDHDNPLVSLEAVRAAVRRQLAGETCGESADANIASVTYPPRPR